MADYRLGKEAREDLMAIALYGDANFGVAQSDKYRDQLKQHFELLARQPKLFLPWIISGRVIAVVSAASIQFIIGLKITALKSSVFWDVKIIEKRFDPEPITIPNYHYD